ncbi:MAG: hypothetical protein V7L22_06600 [Nostoc sp.]|uniref:hypothetical protein n=1 Tax=Nostoc sp. TaxID=1180 RepID=UPI002FF74F9E
MQIYEYQKVSILLRKCFCDRSTLELSPSSIRHDVSQVLNKSRVTNDTEAATTAMQVKCL